MLCTSKSCLWN